MRTTMTKEAIVEMAIRLEYEIACATNMQSLDCIEKEVIVNKDKMALNNYIALMTHIEKKRENVREIEERTNLAMKNKIENLEHQICNCSSDAQINDISMTLFFEQFSLPTDHYLSLMASLKKKEEEIKNNN